MALCRVVLIHKVSLTSCFHPQQGKHTVPFRRHNEHKNPNRMGYKSILHDNTSNEYVADLFDACQYYKCVQLSKCFIIMHKLFKETLA